MRRWRVDDSAELYNINGWGMKYFSINEHGHVAVTPREGHASVDLGRRLPTPGACFCAPGRGKLKTKATPVESPGAPLSDAGSTPAISTKRQVYEHHVKNQVGGVS